MAPTILLVDDSPTILNMLSLMLQQFGYKVVTASDGVKALEVLDRSVVELIITDVNMPRMDGFKLITRIRQDKTLAELPIIVLSTESDTHDRQQAMGLGADLYLTKPLTPDILLKNLRELLTSRAQGA